MFWSKKLYCLKFREVKAFVNYNNNVQEKPIGQINEYVLARSKEKALKKSKLLKEGKLAFISITETNIK